VPTYDISAGPQGALILSGHACCFGNSILLIRGLDHLPGQSGNGPGYRPRAMRYANVMNFPLLADPASALGGGAGGEPGLDAEPVHDRSDVAADRGDADPGAARDRGVGQAFGHQFQDALLGWREPVGARAGGVRGGQRGGAIPQQLEVVAQGGGRPGRG